MHLVPKNQLMADLTGRFEKSVIGSFRYMREAKELDNEFVLLCENVVLDKRRQIRRPIVAAVFPNLISSSLSIPEETVAKLSAAWVAMYGFIRLTDNALDQQGTIGPQKSMAASALLSWSIMKFTEAVYETPYSSTFSQNIMSALSGQRTDLALRGSGGVERRVANTDKNRAVVAVVAAFQAASGNADDRLVKAAEALIGPLQDLDDLVDTEEDFQEGNRTQFVELCESSLSRLSFSETTTANVVDLLIANETFVPILQDIEDRISSAKRMLDEVVDFEIYAYIEYLQHGVGHIIDQSVLARSGDEQARKNVIQCIDTLCVDA